MCVTSVLLKKKNKKQFCPLKVYSDDRFPPLKKNQLIKPESLI